MLNNDLFARKDSKKGDYGDGRERGALCKGGSYFIFANSTVIIDPAAYPDVS